MPFGIRTAYIKLDRFLKAVNAVAAVKPSYGQARENRAVKLRQWGKLYPGGMESNWWSMNAGRGCGVNYMGICLVMAVIIVKIQFLHEMHKKLNTAMGFFIDKNVKAG